MSNPEFAITDGMHEAEIKRIQKRGLTRERLFVLLLGPSATGKSTIISEMNSRSSVLQFEYVKPMTTRANRPGETDKISIDDEKFDQLEITGEFVVVNALYGVRYGTPISGILQPLGAGNIPILDYPLQSVNALIRPEYDLLRFYIYPRSIAEWRARMELAGRKTNERYEAGILELGSLAASQMAHPDIDISVINEDGAAGEAAELILSTIDRSVD